MYGPVEKEKTTQQNEPYPLMDELIEEFKVLRARTNDDYEDDSARIFTMIALAEIINKLQD